jgi:soluble lytic murein transglycosylase
MSWERQNRQSEAIAVYEEIINRFPERAQTEEARWRMGFCQYRLGRYDAAQRAFAPLARTARDFVIKDQAGYWLGLALKARGLPEEARAEWERSAAFSPRSFYSVASAIACGKPVVKGGVVTEPRRTAQEPAGAPAEWDGYVEAEWLATLGQWRFARAILQRSTAGDASTVTEMDSLGDAFESLADYGTSLKWRWRAMWKRTTDDRHHELSPEMLARIYPDFFHDDVRAAASEYGIEPALVWAIIRQESVFDPESRSGADARGLMQIIPPTGAKLAREESLAGYSAQDLYDPGLNIRLGTRYAAQQLRQFGSMDLMAAAYNAGPHNIARWKIDDPDVQREAISFGETRKYVKLVLRNYYVYKALYGD